MPRQANPQARKVFPAYMKQMRAAYDAITQEQIAFKSGVTLSSIQKYETGQSVPAPTQATLLADAFGLKGPARGVFFMAAGHAPPGSTVVVEGEVVLELDEDDLEAPIIHAMSSLAA